MRGSRPAATGIHRGLANSVHKFNWWLPGETREAHWTPRSGGVVKAREATKQLLDARFCNESHALRPVRLRNAAAGPISVESRVSSGHMAAIPYSKARPSGLGLDRLPVDGGHPTVKRFRAADCLFKQLKTSFDHLFSP